MKRDPEKRPLVRKHPNGKVWAWTTDIAKYCGRARHDNFLVAVRKVIAEDKEFAAKNFRSGTYKAKNGQIWECFRMTREGFQAMCRKLHGIHEYEVLYLDAYDLCEHENRKRLEKAEPPDLDPAIIPDDPAALEPLSSGPVHPFMFGELTMRVMDRDGEPWFVAVDVCRALDIVNVSGASERLDDDEKGIVLTDTLGGYQKLLIVSEPGLFKLILRSDKPNAKQFTRWITHEVLPQIRRTGRYEPAPDTERRYGSIEDLRADPDALLSLALGYAGQVKTLTTRLADAEPKAAALDRFADRKGIVNLTQAAKALGIGRNFFCRELRRLHYLYYTGKYDDLVAYEKYVKAGFFEHRPVVITDRQGNQRGTVQPFVTAAGLAEFGKVFGTGVQAVLGQGVLGLSADEALH